MTFDDLCNKVAKELPDGWQLTVEVSNLGICLLLQPPNDESDITLDYDDESTLEQQALQLLTLTKERTYVCKTF